MTLAGVLRRGEFAIDILYRRVRLQEFLVRFDLSHPMMRAYKEHAVCMVNSFRAEVGAKRAIFDLPTAALALAAFLILWRFKVPEPLLIIAAGLIGIAVFWLRGAV